MASLQQKARKRFARRFEGGLVQAKAELTAILPPHSVVYSARLKIGTNTCVFGLFAIVEGEPRSITAEAGFVGDLSVHDDGGVVGIPFDQHGSLTVAHIARSLYDDPKALRYQSFDF